MTEYCVDTCLVSHSGIHDSPHLVSCIPEGQTVLYGKHNEADCIGLEGLDSSPDNRESWGEIGVFEGFSCKE